MCSADRKLNIEMCKEYTVWYVASPPPTPRFVGLNPSFKTIDIPMPVLVTHTRERSEWLTVSQIVLPGAGGKLAHECFGKRMEGNSPEIFFSRLPKTAFEAF